jgi:hypothetical protein
MPSHRSGVPGKAVAEILNLDARGHQRAAKGGWQRDGRRALATQIPSNRDPFQRGSTRCWISSPGAPFARRVAIPVAGGAGAVLAAQEAIVALSSLHPVVNVVKVRLAVRDEGEVTVGQLAVSSATSSRAMGGRRQVYTAKPKKPKKLRTASQPRKNPTTQGVAGSSFIWSGRLDLNQRPPAPEAGALPGYATPRRPISVYEKMRPERVELPTF